MIKAKAGQINENSQSLLNSTINTSKYNISIFKKMKLN